MAGLNEFLRKGDTTQSQRPWPRVLVTAELWSEAIAGLAGGQWQLLGLWGEPDRIHMALRDETDETIIVVSLDCPSRRYPSVALHHPPALRLERAARDLFDLEPVGLPDQRGWLDHGRWDVRHPLAATPNPTP